MAFVLARAGLHGWKLVFLAGCRKRLSIGALDVGDAACDFENRLGHNSTGSREEFGRLSRCTFSPGRRDYSAAGRQEDFKGEAREGDVYTMERCFTAADVETYSQLCGDSNPIHRQISAAKAAGFEGCVVHGMLYAGLFPAIVGSRFPGAVYISQTLEFRGPVIVDEVVVAQVEVVEIKKLRRHYKFSPFPACVSRVSFATTCHKGTVRVLQGTAVSLLPV